MTVSRAPSADYPNACFDPPNSDGEQIPPGPPVKQDFVLHPPSPC